MRKKFLITFAILIGFCLFMLEGCGFWVIFYDMDPRLTVKLKVDEEVSAELKTEFKAYLKKGKYQHYFAQYDFKPNGFYLNAKNLKVRIYGANFYKDTTSFSLYTSKISVLRPDDEEVVAIAKELSARLSAIDGVEEISLKLFQPKR